MLFRRSLPHLSRYLAAARRAVSPIVLAAPMLLLAVLSPIPGPGIPPAAHAEEAVPPADHRQVCASSQHRQFDFWIGTWDVVNRLVPEEDRSDRRATNRISLEEGGCVLAERYVTIGGYTGRSYSFYDAARGVWHQTWIDSRGQALYLEGGFEDGAMVLGGESPGGRRQRITWRPLEDGRVQQLWEVSEDGGESWKKVFDGLYTPLGE